jgi:hypothetical protein
LLFFPCKLNFKLKPFFFILKNNIPPLTIIGEV